MNINVLRIDDRLIHGQIVTAWAKNLNIAKIWIVDDGVATDDFIKGVMEMVAPSDRELVISPLSEINELVPKFDNESGNVLILVKYPYVAEQLFKAGVKIRELNIGGMGANSERKKLFKNISASQAEKNTLSSIRDSGINVYFQVTPEEKRTKYEE